MAKQNPNLPRDTYKNKVLNLEKKYFQKILEVVNSSAFIQDLLLIEKEIRENYPEYRDIWDLKNKIKVPAERLTRHHIYTQWHDLIDGIYPSPVSSDIGIRTNDAVICIDLKTIDTNGNAGDLRATAVENNQTSFNNKNYPYIKTASNLKSIDHYTRKPVLTYVVKIVYTDDKYSFTLSRNTFPTLIVACVPNGEISQLFDYNIIDNFKTYNYYSKKDGDYYSPIEIPRDTKNISEYVKDQCVNLRNYISVNIQGKDAYFDMAHNTLWWQTSQNNKTVIAAVKSGGSVRFNNEILKERFDAENNKWDGYIEITISDEMA